MKERRAHGEEIGRGEVGAGAVLAGEVEEVLVGGNGGDEGGGVGEVFEVEELGFDGGVAAFDIGVGVRAGGRIEAMEGAQDGDRAVEAVRAGVDGVAVELGKRPPFITCITPRQRTSPSTEILIRNALMIVNKSRIDLFGYSLFSFFACTGSLRF
jgi:hypothetical protein